MPAGTVTVRRLLGDEPFRGKLMAFGVVPGGSAVVVEGGARRPLVLALQTGRLMLDWQSSERVVVDERRPVRIHRGDEP